MESRSVTVGSETIDYDLRRSTRKTLGISVSPDQTVMVSAPANAELKDIEKRIRLRAGWILDKQAGFAARPIRALPRHFKPGETFLYLGNQYRLRVDPDRVGVIREGSRIVVGAVQPDEPFRIRNRLVRWYAKEAREILPAAVDRCFRAFRAEIATKPRLLIRPVKMRWGSYLPASNSLILNRSLVQVSTQLLDYVVTHELAHARHPDHGEAFITFLTEKMPDWKLRKRALERVAPELFDVPVLR